MSDCCENDSCVYYITCEEAEKTLEEKRERKMREFLFRGKNNEEWIFGDLLNAHEDQSKYFIRDLTTNNSYAVVPDTIGQYTGVKDENNIRIFEKDIISIPYKDMFGFVEYQQAMVFWDNERLAWCVRFMDGEVLYLNDVIDPDSSMDILVVDNIIDNKELAEAWE